MYETTIVASAYGTLMVKLPLMSVTAPVVRPFTVTDAPMSPSLVCLSTTLPFTTICRCCSACTGIVPFAASAHNGVAKVRIAAAASRISPFRNLILNLFSIKCY